MEPRRQHSFLPDFCSARMLFVVVLLGELLAIVLILTPVGKTGRERIADLPLYSLFIQWIILSCMALLCLMRNHLNRLADVWAASLSYLLTLLVAAVITEFTWHLHIYVFTPGSQLSTHTGFFFRHLGISAIISALCLRYFYVQHQGRKNLEAEANARIQAMQARIRPHFLFNCMNTIASLTRGNPALAEQATEDLADLFRVNLSDASRPATLAEEITLCRRYLRIEAHRFGKRLVVEWRTDTLPEDAQLPALTLQPILENAIYHGIEHLPEGGIIHISGQQLDKEIIICIDNPLPTAGERHQGRQIAQDNIRQRLSAYFGNRGKLIVESKDQLYLTKIVIPYPYENSDR